MKLVNSVFLMRPYSSFKAFPFSSVGSAGTSVEMSKRNVSVAFGKRYTLPGLDPSSGPTVLTGLPGSGSVGFSGSRGLTVTG